jgi:hypothetical protein
VNVNDPRECIGLNWLLEPGSSPCLLASDFYNSICLGSNPMKGCHRSEDQFSIGCQAAARVLDPFGGSRRVGEVISTD